MLPDASTLSMPSLPVLVALCLRGQFRLYCTHLDVDGALQLFHFAQHCLQQRRLSRTHTAHDGHQRAFGYHQVDAVT